MADPITETDLIAFVDDELDVARRIEVEEYLARSPESAARVMADLRARDSLRLAFGGRIARHPSMGMMEAVRRLERGLVWRRIGLRLRRAAAVALLVGTGWLAHAQVGLIDVADSEASPAPPAFVEDARHSHQTALVRARMVSQPGSAAYDAAEILAQTGIALPALPRHWRVLDAQIFPSRLGHSVALELEAEALGRVSVFAARSPSFDVTGPSLSRSPQGTTVYWQSGELVYALTGSAPETAMEQAAVRLHASLR
jgi:anti-sigma factor RsiW